MPEIKQEFLKVYSGSINIQGTILATWAGWFLTYEEAFILLADESQLG
jgi:hydroxyacylglutathione hydrolase